MFVDAQSLRRIRHMGCIVNGVRVSHALQCHVAPTLVTLYLYRLGCGNGKYLSVNHSIFKIGVDRCKRFTDIAREKENEVRIN